MKSLKFVLATAWLVLFSSNYLTAQYDLAGFLNETEIEIDDPALDATDPSMDIAWVATNRSILSQTDRVLDIQEHRTLKVNSSAIGEADEFCWKDTERRGVGKIPKKCENSSDEFKAGLCYPKCKDGYRGATIFCRRVCPSGFRDDGIYCRKPGVTNRPGGDYVSEKRCREKTGMSCTKSPVRWRPNCPSGTRPVPGRPNQCMVSCPSGLSDVPGVPLSCRKAEYKRGVGKVPKGCDNGMEYQAGLCYSSCPSGFNGVGPICWADCPSGWANCGMACATSRKECAKGIVKMITTPLEAIVKIAGLVLSGGSTGAVTVSSSAGAILEIAETAVDAGSTIASSVVESDLIRAAGGNPTAEQREGFKEYAALVEEASRTHDISWEQFASLDPTGLANVAVAYAKPRCSKLQASSGGTGTGKVSNPSSSASNNNRPSTKPANRPKPKPRPNRRPRPNAQKEIAITFVSKAGFVPVFKVSGGKIKDTIEGTTAGKKPITRKYKISKGQKLTVTAQQKNGRGSVKGHIITDQDRTVTVTGAIRRGKLN